MSNELYNIVATFTDASAEESPHEDKVSFFHVIRCDPDDELNYQIIETYNTFEEAQEKIRDLEKAEELEKKSA